MRFSKRAGLLSALLLTSAAVLAQKISHFNVSPEKPAPGQTITVSYNPRGTVLENKGPVKMLILCNVNYRWKVSEISLQKKDSLWTVLYTVPDKAALITAKFKSGALTDDGGQATYSWFIQEPGKGNMPGGYMAWAHLRNKTLREYYPHFVNERALIGDSVVLFWYNQEMRYHPESRRHTFYPALKLLNTGQKERAKSAARREIPFMLGLPDVSEQELLQVAEVFRRVLSEPQRADSLEQVILSKYPKGILARDKEIFRLFIEPDIKKKEMGFQQFLADFPPEKFKELTTEAEELYYAKLIRGIVYTHIKNKDYEAFVRYLPLSPYSSMADYEYHVVELPMEQKFVTPEFILPYSNLIIGKLEILRKDNSGKEAALYAPSEWDSLVVSQNANSYFTHVAVLHQLNKDKEALKFALMIRDKFRYRNSEFNSTYVSLLEKNGRGSEVIPYIKNCAAENALTPEMIAALEADYRKTHKGGEGFDAYLSSLKSAKHAQEQKASLRSELIDLPIESFTLESLNGDTVSLDAQKGRIVILDFWATWCGPCKAAMPGMQLVVNKYKNDPGVQFYFIATQEAKPDYREQIRKFLQEKKYTFNVLYDKSGPAGNHLDDTYARYAKAFGFSGIPQKMIIDGNRRLRWRSTGYNGSPSALADEISFVIETLKQEHPGSDQ